MTRDELMREVLDAAKAAVDAADAFVYEGGIVLDGEAFERLEDAVVAFWQSEEDD